MEKSASILPTAHQHKAENNSKLDVISNKEKKQSFMIIYYGDGDDGGVDDGD